jgi:uncharacterized protein (DUF2062 family)
MYYMEYLTGNLLLGKEGIDSVELTMHWFKQNWDEIVIPLYTGTAFYSLVVAPIVASVVNLLWIRSVKDEKRQRCNRLRPPKETP